MEKNGGFVFSRQNDRCHENTSLQTVSDKVDSDIQDTVFLHPKPNKVKTFAEHQDDDMKSSPITVPIIPLLFWNLLKLQGKEEPFSS